MNLSTFIQNIHMPAKDSATTRGIKTSAQAFIGTFLIIPITNLIVKLWATPGVPEIVQAWLMDYFVLIATSLGISSGIVAFVWNIVLRKDVKTY